MKMHWPIFMRQRVDYWARHFDEEWIFLARESYIPDEYVQGKPEKRMLIWNYK